MECYREAIKLIARRKTVVDVGAGLGVLSIFAHESGASNVVGIENTRIYKIAKETILKRGL
jgi:predicted RNA methylase